MSDTIKPKVKSLYKALSILNYFDEEHYELGVTEIAEHSGLLKSTVHNILQTFECCGYVAQNYDNNKYQIGSAALELFSKFRAAHRFDYRISECLQEIKNEFNVNVYLGLKEKNEVIYVCAESAFQTKGDYLSKVGAKAPLHCTSLGKILLGYSSIEERTAFYNSEIKTYTPNTISDVAMLRKQIEEIVYQGYATSYSEFRLDMFCVAVPVIMGYQEVRYALGLATQKPFSSYQLKKYVKVLKDKSKIIASLLSTKLSGKSD